MNLPTYPRFEAIRLTDFIERSDAIEDVFGQEWMGGQWNGQAIGFSGIWWLVDEPGRVGGLEVAYSELEAGEQRKLSFSLNLPLQQGMLLPDLSSIVGKPRKTHQFVSDRKSYDFIVGAEWPYHLSCTIHETDGLIYFALLRENALARCSLD